MRRGGWCSIWDALTHCWKSERGNIGLLGALSILPVIVCVGAAIDFERGLNAETQLQSALDSATLYATAYATDHTNATNAQLVALAKPYLTSNYEDAADATITAFSLVDNGNSITGLATIQYKTYFMAVAGYDTLSLNADSTVQKGGINLEVSLVLDNTNSMNHANPQTGNTAISDLKSAAAKFVAKVMPPTQGVYYTKIAMVPYNNSVNLGSATMAAAARGAIKNGNAQKKPGRALEQFNTSPTYYASYSSNCQNYSPSSTAACQITLPVTNCVTERTGGEAYTDASLSAHPAGWNYANASTNGCTAAPVVPLTTSAGTLTAAVDTMSAGGSTGGQIGVAWGWYTLSPNVGIWSGSSVPASYSKLTANDATKVRKVMILMTDGEYNSAYCNGVISGYDTTNGTAGNPYYWSVVGSGDPADHIGCAPTNGGSYTQADAMCSAIKAAGIEIFVITFQLDRSYSQRVNFTNNCATDSNHVIDADTMSLDGAFDSLGNRILAMRISQ